MRFNQETINNLKVLGFPEDVLPKMKELRNRYLELSLVGHPDKDTGTDEDFKELLNAHEEIGKLIVQVNKTSVTNSNCSCTSLGSSIY